VPFCLPQIPHGVACDQTQSFGVKLVTEQWHSAMFTLMSGTTEFNGDGDYI